MVQVVIGKGAFGNDVIKRGKRSLAPRTRSWVNFGCSQPVGDNRESGDPSANLENGLLTRMYVYLHGAKDGLGGRRELTLQVWRPPAQAVANTWNFRLVWEVTLQVNFGDSMMLEVGQGRFKVHHKNPLHYSDTKYK